MKLFDEKAFFRYCFLSSIDQGVPISAPLNPREAKMRYLERCAVGLACGGVMAVFGWFLAGVAFLVALMIGAYNPKTSDTWMDLHAFLAVCFGAGGLLWGVIRWREVLEIVTKIADFCLPRIDS